jgi:hypothetical protein
MAAFEGLNIKKRKKPVFFGDVLFIIEVPFEKLNGALMSCSVMSSSLSAVFDCLTMGKAIFLNAERFIDNLTIWTNMHHCFCFHRGLFLFNSHRLYSAL